MLQTVKYSFFFTRNANNNQKNINIQFLKPVRIIDCQLQIEKMSKIREIKLKRQIDQNKM